MTERVALKAVVAESVFGSDFEKRFFRIVRIKSENSQISSLADTLVFFFFCFFYKKKEQTQINDNRLCRIRNEHNTIAAIAVYVVIRSDNPYVYSYEIFSTQWININVVLSELVVFPSKTSE